MVILIILLKKILILRKQANNCESFEWRQSAYERLAEIIVLDQFSKNLFNDTAKAFDSNSLVLALAQEAISLGLQHQHNQLERSFIIAQ
jgi:uncharacterized protein (DUF924 family)|tara:strand:- start:5942 stop:6208 length:267 start_codon:yes stop_codon:yes gene_type:complete